MKRFIFSLSLGLALVAVLVIPQFFSANSSQLMLASGSGLPPIQVPTGGGGGKLMLASGSGLPPIQVPTGGGGGKLMLASGSGLPPIQVPTGGGGGKLTSNA